MKICRNTFLLLFLFLVFSCTNYTERHRTADIFEFDIRENGIIIVPAKLGDVPYNLMIDTGSDASVFRKETANILRKTFLFPVLAKDLGQKFVLKSKWKSKEALQIGGFNFGKLQFVVDELDDLMLKNVHGIIGTDILKQCVLQLDYSRGKGYLIPFHKFDDTNYPHYKKVKINKNSHISIEVEQQTYTMLIDSGAEGYFLDIDNRIMLKDSVVIKKSKFQSACINSTFHIETEARDSKNGFMIDDISISPIIYQTYEFPKRGVFADVDVIAGIDFISKLNWIFDYSNKTVYIEKPDTFNCTIENYEIESCVLYEHLPALYFEWRDNKNPLIDLFGSKADDKIFAINGISFKECTEKLGNEDGYNNFCTVIESLDFDSLTVIRNGKQITLNRKE